MNSTRNWRRNCRKKSSYRRGRGKLERRLRSEPQEMSLDGASRCASTASSEGDVCGRESKTQSTPRPRVCCSKDRTNHGDQALDLDQHYAQHRWTLEGDRGHAPDLRAEDSSGAEETELTRRAQSSPGLGLLPLFDGSISVNLTSRIDPWWALPRSPGDLPGFRWICVFQWPGFQITGCKPVKNHKSVFSRDRTNRNVDVRQRILRDRAER